MIGSGLYEAAAMFWETLWALVLGFGLSGAVQAFVSRERMQRALGDHKPKALATATFFGMVSSSCSYAASALGKTLFGRGADFVTSLVFMIASTNLVVELGLVLWLLMGWEFALAEFVGGAIMIALLGLIGPRLLGGRVADEAREHLASAAPSGHMHGADASTEASVPLGERLRSRAGWADAASYTISDLRMIWKELIVGFLVAGLLTALVPVAVWQSVLLTGHGILGSLENVVVAPFLAIISFVCSVGNVPLAAALWHGGISFGGVVAFVFADLIAMPLLLIYRGYFGTRVTARILFVFWLCMSSAGLAVEYLFAALRVPIPPRDSAAMTRSVFGWNHTTWLNVAALIVFGVLVWLFRTRPTSDRYAIDPVCGMQIEIALAAASRERDGQRYYFCSDRCAHRFDEEPHHHTGENMQHSMTGSHVDPVCHMRVDPETAAGSLEHEGVTYYFCSTGCRTAFGMNPTAFLAAAE